MINALAEKQGKCGSESMPSGFDQNAVAQLSNDLTALEKQDNAMNVRRKKLTLATFACIVPLVCGFGGFAPRANAQTVASLTRSTNGAPSAAQDAARGNAELQQRVAAALHAQPYLDDRHIDVSVRGGTVVLSGIVFSGWDLQDALHTARNAAGGNRVVDSLSIEEGGR
jgi:hypothetical protein